MTPSPLTPRRRSKHEKARSNLSEKEGAPSRIRSDPVSKRNYHYKQQTKSAVRGGRKRRYSRGSMVVEVEGDGDALDAGLGAGERHLLVRDDEGRVGSGGGGGEADEEEGDEREGPRHG